MKIRQFALVLFSVLLPAMAAGDELLVDPDPKGYAAGVVGQVLVLEPEADEPKTLADSDPVFEGSRITASENAFAEIDLIDGSEVKIDEMSQVDLSKVSSDPESLDREIDLSMLYGTLRISAQNGFSDKSVFKITTPAAVVGVRGTDFAVEYESENEASVDVFEGEIGVGQDGAVETVGEGEAATTGKGKGIAKSKLQEHRKDRWDHFKEAMNVHGHEKAADRLREKIEQVRAANPDDPRLGGLENALQNVSKNRAEAKTRFEAAREKMKDRRGDRLERMRDFAKKHGRERFEQARKFRGGALTPEERQKAGGRIRERRENTREKATERHKERKQRFQEGKEGREQKLKEQRGERQENIKERRDNRRENVGERRENRRENIDNRKENRRDNRQERRETPRERRRK